MDRGKTTEWLGEPLEKARSFSKPLAIICVPALSLIAFWVGGEKALIVLAISIPILWVIIQRRPNAFEVRKQILVKGTVSQKQFHRQLDTIYRASISGQKKSVLFVLELDDFASLRARFEPNAADHVLNVVGERLAAVMRENDIIARVGDCRFGICTDPALQLDLESGLQMASRIQEAVEEPISLKGTSVYITGTLGFCLLARAPGKTSGAWFDAALLATNEASRNGHNSVRAYSSEMHKNLEKRGELRKEVETALEQGQIQAWFQPQISTDTGEITGFEALARWVHPMHGALPPGDFLPALEEAGQLQRLSEIMVTNALIAITQWDKSGVHVPSVAVNFSGDELSNPKLVDVLKWEFDKFELAPERLSVEILETVVSDLSDDTIVRNIRTLQELGCKIDLDDFGTGYASIASLKRFGVNRIKIDRSFVIKVDRDPEQQRMISAILTMAERLELKTLAEGVETAGEHAMLSQLGCDYVQGYGIGRPMPFEKTLVWCRAHEAKLAKTPAFPTRKPK